MIGHVMTHFIIQKSVCGSVCYFFWSCLMTHFMTYKVMNMDALILLLPFSTFYWNVLFWLALSSIIALHLRSFTNYFLMCVLFGRDHQWVRWSWKIYQPMLIDNLLRTTYCSSVIKTIPVTNLMILLGWWLSISISQFGYSISYQVDGSAFN